MTETPNNSPSSPPFAEKWQIPLFIAGVLLCALAVWQFLSREPRLTWEDRFQHVVAEVHSVGDGNYIEADQQAEELLKRTPPEALSDLAMLHELRAEIRWRSIQFTDNRTEGQWRALISLYEAALQCGLDKTAEIAERMAVANDELGQIDASLEQYRAAWELDATREPKLKRRAISLARQHYVLDMPGRLELLNDYLDTPGLSESQYGWAIGEKLGLLISQGRLVQAQQLIENELKEAENQGFRDQLLLHKARALGGQGQIEQADDILIELVERVNPTDELYAKANLLRGGLIWQDNAEESLLAFQNVLERSPGTAMATAARVGMGRALARMNLQTASLAQYRRALEEWGRFSENECISLQEIRQALHQNWNVLMTSGRAGEALRFVQLEREILALEHPTPLVVDELDLLGRLAGSHLAAAGADSTQELDAPARRDHLRQAGHLFLERAGKAEAVNDAVHGESLWMAIRAFEEAGLYKEAIAAIRLFISGRPSDPRLPEARFRLGQMLQSQGRYAEAIEAYEANRQAEGITARHIKTIEGLIPLARCHMALGEDHYDQAELILLSIVDDEHIVTPDSDLYRDALFILGRLHYLQKKWQAAVFRLGEAIQRDGGQPLPTNVADPGGQRERFRLATHSTYLMAECYKGMAMESGVRALNEQNLLRREDMRRAKVEQLVQADLTYQQVIQRLESLPGPLNELDEAYRRNSYFARGDCFYELGIDDPSELSEAINRYEQAVFLFQQHPTAIGGLVQIYNCHMALDQPVEAQAANERARVLLDRMEKFPQDSAAAGSLDDWKQWLASVDVLNPTMTREELP